jgi:hypothetical protein
MAMVHGGHIYYSSNNSHKIWYINAIQASSFKINKTFQITVLLMIRNSLGKSCLKIQEQLLRITLFFTSDNSGGNERKFS